MDGKAHEGVYLLPLGEVFIVKDGGRKVHHLGVRAVHLRREAERHPVGRIHRNDVVAGHGVGFLDEVSFASTASKHVGVIAPLRDEAFPSETSRAAYLHVGFLVAVKEITAESVNLFLKCHYFWNYLYICKGDIGY